jgi:Chemotaxis signal transduction protein
MAKKFNLREFQTDLSRRIQAASARDNSASRLGFRSGSINWMVPLGDTEEVIPVPRIVPIPGSRRWFRGVANIRGNLYAVNDLADFIGQGVTPEHAECRLVIPHHDLWNQCRPAGERHAWAEEHQPILDFVRGDCLFVGYTKVCRRHGQRVAGTGFFTAVE